MNKHALSLLLALLLAFALAGCSTDSSPSGSASVPGSSSQGSSPQAVASVLPGEEPLLSIPLPDFLDAGEQQLYQDAFRILYHFQVSGGWEVDQQAAGVTHGPYNWVYYPDNAFPSYQAFRETLEKVFPASYVDQLLTEYPIYLEVDGKLYCSGGARGTNLFYQSSEFSLVSRSQEEVVFTRIDHYDDSELTPDGAQAEGPTTQEHTFTLRAQQDGWRLTSFTLPY